MFNRAYCFKRLFKCLENYNSLSNWKKGRDYCGNPLTCFLLRPFLKRQPGVLEINFSRCESQSSSFSSTADWKVNKLVAWHFCRRFRRFFTARPKHTCPLKVLKKSWRSSSSVFNQLLIYSNICKKYNAICGQLSLNRAMLRSIHYEP